jgi:hypothetical protein
MTLYTENPHKLAAQLDPDKVCAYFVSQGHLLVISPNPVAAYQHPTSAPWSVAEVPLNPALRDYGRRMYEALQHLDGPFLGVLHKIDPVKFSRERILVLVGVTV